MKDPDRRAISRRRYAARREGIHFTLEYRDIGPAPSHCPCCGVRMERGPPGFHVPSPTLERLVPGLGYTADNVIWLCGLCNSTKSNHGVADLYQVADFFWSEYKKRGWPLPATRLHPNEETSE